MSGEKRFWENIRSSISSMADYDRIESGDTATGRPDLNLCLYGTGKIWDIELKWFGTNGFKVRPAQKRWIKNRTEAGGNCCILLRMLDHTMLIPGRNVSSLKGNIKNMGYYHSLADIYWVRKINWTEFEEYLNANQK